MTYNTRSRRSRPTSSPGCSAFKPREYFEIEEAAKEPVKVQF